LKIHYTLKVDYTLKIDFTLRMLGLEVMVSDFKWYYGVATISRLLKIQVSFAEYRRFYRALVQNRPIILRSLLLEATPYSKSLVKSGFHFQ